MRKEIEALKNLIAAMDAEEKARHHKEDESQRAHRAPIVLDERGKAVLSASHSQSIADWAKAFNELAAARGTAKYLIEKEEREEADEIAALSACIVPVARKCFDCDDGADDCHMNCGPRDDENGPAARLTT